MVRPATMSQITPNTANAINPTHRKNALPIAPNMTPAATTNDPSGKANAHQLIAYGMATFL